MLHKVHWIGTFMIPREDWHQETVHLKVLLIVPGVLGRIENGDLFDSSLIAGVADYSYLHHASLEIHRQGTVCEKAVQLVPQPQDQRDYPGTSPGEIFSCHRRAA